MTIKFKLGQKVRVEMPDGIQEGTITDIHPNLEVARVRLTDSHGTWCVLAQLQPVKEAEQPAPDIRRIIDKHLDDCWRLPLVPINPRANFGTPTHIHIKSGGKYRLVSSGILEATMMPVIIYQAADGTTWVRPADEFARRFRPIEKETSAEGPMTGSIANAAREVAETVAQQHRASTTHVE